MQLFWICTRGAFLFLKHFLFYFILETPEPKVKPVRPKGPEKPATPPKAATTTTTTKPLQKEKSVVFADQVLVPPPPTIVNKDEGRKPGLPQAPIIFLAGKKTTKPESAIFHTKRVSLMDNHRSHYYSIAMNNYNIYKNIMPTIPTNCQIPSLQYFVDLFRCNTFTVSLLTSVDVKHLQ